VQGELTVTIRIAMWSGPRNISTAMMRSWENRSDCVTVDEPFYACYLWETGVRHPCRDAILRTQSRSREEVVRQLCQLEVGARIFYQKHMTHHMPRGMDMAWCRELRHCFLIREPARVIASYLDKMPHASEEAIGIVRQEELFNEIADILGQAPVVIDAGDVLRDPARVLEELCNHLGVPWDPEAMLRWPPGRRDSDGVWAPYWYHSVEASTGFAPYDARPPGLSPDHAALADRMLPCYQRLAARRIGAVTG
jgi:hypothetical protein